MLKGFHDFKYLFVATCEIINFVLIIQIKLLNLAFPPLEQIANIQNDYLGVFVTFSFLLSQGLYSGPQHMANITEGDLQLPMLTP